MEKKHQRHARSRSGGGGVLASFLRSTAASFSSVPSSGGNGKASSSSFNHRNAFSGPIVSIVPPEARGGRKGGGGRSGYRTPEPSSPKVSCIGQIKKNKSRARKAIPCGKSGGGACPLLPRPQPEGHQPKGSLVKRMFFRRSKSRSSRSRDVCKRRASTAVAAAPTQAPAPVGLGKMKRFTSGRAAFQDFDWRREVEVEEEEEEEEEMFVAHSAPLVLGGGVVASEPRKEVNLWRRRPMGAPSPLQLP